MDYYYYYILRRVRWVVYVALWRRGEVHTGVWWVNLGERDHLEDPGIDRGIILKLIFKQWNGAWIGMIWVRIGTGGRLL